MSAGEAQKSKRKRIVLNAGQKRDIVIYMDERPQTSHSNVAEIMSTRFGVSISRRTISDIYASRERWLEKDKDGRKSCKTGNFTEVEKILIQWVTNARLANLAITDEILRMKAKEIAQLLAIEMTASVGWTVNFKKRYGISSKKLSGESASADMDAVSSGIITARSAIARYEPRNVFNVDETGLFYRMMPEKTLTVANLNKGTKVSKQRVTLLLGTNSDGSEKLKPLLIGTSKVPRAFKNFNFESYVEYDSSKKAWMNSKIWFDWLKRFDDKLGKEKRKVLLLVDNAPSHHDPGFLNWIELFYLPPNVTSMIQPMDAGIINSFKCYYKKKLINFMIKCFDEKKEPEINMKTVVKWTFESWAQVTNQAIANCWRHTKLIGGEPDQSVLEDQPNIEIDVAKFHKTLNINLNEKVSAKEYLNDAVETELISINIQEMVDANHAVNDENEFESSENEIIELNVKSDEALKAINTVIQFCDQNASLNVENSIKNLYQLKTLIEKEQRQRDAQTVQPMITSFSKNVINE